MVEQDLRARGIEMLADWGAKMVYTVSLMQQITSRSERMTILNPNIYRLANVVCADGFFVRVAIFKQDWEDFLREDSEAPIPQELESLHNQFHDVAGFEKCEGISYSL